jgi:multidrug efflux system membrane fusion protein
VFSRFSRAFTTAASSAATAARLSSAWARAWSCWSVERIPSANRESARLAQAEESRAAVAADEAAVVNARLNLEYTDVRSPINGRTGSLLVQVGNMVKSVDGATLVVINRVDPVYVTFSVPEQRLAEVRAAQGTGALAVEAVIPGDSGQAPVGKLSFLDNTVDRQTGTIRLKATFANADGRLWPGQFVTTRLILGVRAGVVVVPAAAVQTGQKGSYVFVVKPDHTVEQRTVVADTANETEAVVQQGVSAGETVVTDGQLNLVPGAHVTVRDSGTGDKTEKAGGRP